MSGPVCQGPLGRGLARQEELFRSVSAKAPSRVRVPDPAGGLKNPSWIYAGEAPSWVPRETWWGLLKMHFWLGEVPTLQGRGAENWLTRGLVSAAFGNWV